MHIIIIIIINIFGMYGMECKFLSYLQDKLLVDFIHFYIILLFLVFFYLVMPCVLGICLPYDTSFSSIQLNDVSCNHVTRKTFLVSYCQSFCLSIITTPLVHYYYDEVISTYVLNTIR